MTALRKKMTDELVRRNDSEGTARAYLGSVEQFARYFHRPPDQLGPEHIREYAAHLFEARQLSSSSVCQQVAALRFFYVKTFRKGWSVEDTPYPKRGNSLPLILSVEEVSQLVDAADTPFHRTLLMTAYGTGARRAEIANLQIVDIDKSMMRIHIREGKGGKDREVPLSPTLYEELRQHDRRPNRKCGCFPAVPITPPTTPSVTKWSGTPAELLPNALVSAKPSTPIPSDIALPLTCTTRGPTSAPFRNSSVITT